MPRYTVTFERIGRRRDVKPLTVAVATDIELCAEIERYARPQLRSRDFDALVDLDKGTGFIACGMHSGGSFTVRQD
jgi:hypothetical protein